MSEIELKYIPKQSELFDDPAKFKIVGKGRRFGLTHGLALHVIENCIDGTSPILWVDTVNSNIERYFDRYFMPVLKGLPKNSWKYNRQKGELKIYNSVVDFRSAESPENIEGFGYRLIIINEAGIIFKNRNLWEESIHPMVMDFGAKVIIGGTPKGRTYKGKEHLFYELYKKGEADGVRWKSFNYSSYDNPLLSKIDVDELVEDTSPFLIRQQIYGEFINTFAKGIIRKEWLPTFDYNFRERKVIKLIQAWDTAFKAKEENDYSVCQTWALMEDEILLVHMWAGKVEFPELKIKFKELYNEIQGVEEVLIEDKASGQSLIQEMERDSDIRIIKIKPDSDKISRVHAVTPIMAQGKVKVYKYLDYLDLFYEQSEEFPNAEHDDIVDDMSQSLLYLKPFLGMKPTIDHVSSDLKMSSLTNNFRNLFFN
jgi:predicted phage terminase large subunit-like protein